MYVLKSQYENTGLDYQTIIKNFNEYKQYYRLIRTIDTTNLKRLEPVKVKIMLTSIIKEKIQETITNHDLIQKYIAVQEVNE